MKIFDAFLQGLRGVTQTKRYILLIYVINLFVVLVLGATLADSIQSSIGDSLAGEKMLESFDGLWYRGFSAQAEGLAQTFEPGVVGIGSVFNGLDSFLKGDLFEGHTLIAGLGLLYLLLWTFLSAGLIAKYSNTGESGSFFQQAARFFPRFMILSLLAGVLYFLLFGYVMDWVSKMVDELTRETIDERVHFTYTVFKYLFVWLLVWSVNILFDYSKIFTVLKDHQNALTAPLKAAKLVFRNFSKTYGLYLLLGAVWVGFMLLYWLIAPGAGQDSWVAIIAAFLLGQLYFISRIAVRCLFYSGQTALWQTLAMREE
ncbi:MAG: hypothetical protein ACE5IR_04080 [bacterium]